MSASPSERLGFLGIGLLANQAMIWGVDLVLYPFVLWYLGLLAGAVVMTFLSFLACYGTIRFYDWSKKDWLGIETVKNLKERNRQLGLVRGVSHQLHRNQ